MRSTVLLAFVALFVGCGWNPQPNPRIAVSVGTVQVGTEPFMTCTGPSEALKRWDHLCATGRVTVRGRWIPGHPSDILISIHGMDPPYTPREPTVRSYDSAPSIDWHIWSTGAELTAYVEQNWAHAQDRLPATQGEIVFDQVPIGVAGGCTRARFSLRFDEVEVSGTVEAPYTASGSGRDRCSP